jgi:hypothetical protein
MDLKHLPYFSESYNMESTYIIQLAHRNYLLAAIYVNLMIVDYFPLPDDFYQLFIYISLLLHIR